MNATAHSPTIPRDFSLPWPAAGRRLSPALDLPRLCVDAALIVGLLLINKAGTPGAVAFFAILAIMVLRSPEAAFKAVAICYLGLMLNSAFVPKSLVWTPGRLVIPFLVLIRFTGDMAAMRQSLLARSSYIALLFFVATMAVCSVMSGWYTHIALLKLLNFLVFTTMIYSAVVVIRARRKDVGEWFVALILAATVIGIASVALRVSTNYRSTTTAYGEILPGSMFNGAFVHPNAHTIYASLFIAFLAIVWILSRYRHTWLALPIIGAWFTFMGWSASRSSFVAAIVGILVLIAYSKPFRNRRGWRILPKVRRGTLVAGSVAAVVGLMVLDATTNASVSRKIYSFINKSAIEDAALNTDVILSSRKGLIEYSYQNFRENPVFGIGFGVAKTEQFVRNATLFTAPVEKGFLPTAILEEGGILGAGALLVFLISFLWELHRERNVAGFVIFVTFLATNLGEATIFAPGGGGSFGWTMVGAGLLLGDQCWSPDRSTAVPRAGRP